MLLSDTHKIICNDILRYLHNTKLRPRRSTWLLTAAIVSHVDKMSRDKQSFNLLIDTVLDVWIDLNTTRAKSIYNGNIPRGSTELFRSWKYTCLTYLFWAKAPVLMSLKITEWFSDVTSYLIVTKQLWQILRKYKEDIQSFLNPHIWLTETQ